MTISRRRWLSQVAQWNLALAAPTYAFTSSLAQAQQVWPSKSLKLVVPFTPGGTTDFVTRLVAIELVWMLLPNRLPTVIALSPLQTALPPIKHWLKNYLTTPSKT